MTERLAEDHANAKRLAKGLSEMPGIDIDPATVETNIVFFRVTSMPAAEFVAKVKKAKVLVLAAGSEVVRAVTHLDVTSEQIEEALGIFEKVTR